MTVAEVAKALDLSEGRVRVLCQQGRLGQRVAGVWLITAAELDAFKRTRRGPGRPPSDKAEHPPAND